MLPKKRRIERSGFPAILSKGKRYNSPHLILYISKFESNDSDKDSRFSFSVSKKISKLAVNRNKLRRRGYSIISKYLNNIKPGFYCFFSFKKGGEKISFGVLDKEIKELLYQVLVLS